MSFHVRSPGGGGARQICELGRMVVPPFRRGDVNVIATGSRHLPGLLEGGFGRLPAVNQIAVLAPRFYREAHFFFFFLFFLMISAWVLKACASVLIWSAT